MLILRGERVVFPTVPKPRRRVKKVPGTMAGKLIDKSPEEEERRKGKTARNHPGEGRGERGKEKEEGRVLERIP